MRPPELGAQMSPKSCTFTLGRASTLTLTLTLTLTPVFLTLTHWEAVQSQTNRDARKNFLIFSEYSQGYGTARHRHIPDPPETQNFAWWLALTTRALARTGYLNLTSLQAHWLS